MLSLRCLFSKYVGQDAFSNRYYERKKGFFAKKSERKVRFVVYHGIKEPSKVPPQWHAWLHYTVDTPPHENVHHPMWSKNHTPNLTGTKHAYMPKGSLLREGERQKAGGDYVAWSG